MKLKIISLLIIKNRRSLKTITAILIMTLFLTAPLTTIQKTPIKAQQTIQTLTNPITNEIINDSVLDIEYIYNITKALSNIIFTEYNESAGEIAKGRSFGTKGEHKAAQILYENMTRLGLYTWKEPIKNIPLELPDVASKYEILDYKLTITNISSNTSEVVDCYIAPTWKGERETPEQKNHNFSFKGLKIKHKPEKILPWMGLQLADRENYVLIYEDTSYNPDMSEPVVKKILNMFLSPYSDYTLLWNWLKLITELSLLYNFFPHCQGLIRYDFNKDTYNIVNSANWRLPVIFINGTIGQKILKDIDNYRIDYHINQRYNESVTSYNVIGQLNGTDPNKTVIIDSLYDGWWCQATADSAIGMAMVLGVAKYFRDHNITPKYNIKFIGFCGEEHGFRGAKYYEAAHKNENIIYVIDLNQLGFKQEWPELSLDLLVNNKKFMDEIWPIAEKSDYKERVENITGLRKFWIPRGAPSNDQPFARSKSRPFCKTVCFLKGVNWILHHRDGHNHTEGDVLKYFDPIDVSVTGEIVLNITKYITVESQTYT